MLQGTKDLDSDSEAQVWSFDRATNEVFSALTTRIMPKTTKEKTHVKPLSGIEHLMESHATPLLGLPQSKLVENTTKFIQDKLNTEKCCKEKLGHVSCTNQVLQESEPILPDRERSNSRGRCFLVRLV